MRRRMRATSKNAVLIRRYDLSSEVSRKKITDALDELYGLTKELSALAKLGKRKQKQLVSERVSEIAEEFDRAAATLTFELGVVLSNAKSVAALLEVATPKSALRERVESGTYRACVMERYDEISSRYRKILNENPKIWEV